MALFRNSRFPLCVNIFKFNFRSCSQAYLTNLQTEEKPQHIYKKKFAKSELIDHMINSIIYNQDGIVVLDKPYGISVRSEPDNFRTNFKPKTFETLCLNDVIHDIKERLGVGNLKISRTPERYCSGILILTTDEVGEKNLWKYVRRSEGKTIPTSYLVVTQYNPCKEKNKANYGLMLEDKTNKRFYHLAENWSYASQKRNETLSIHVAHKTLCSSDFGSLVRVNIIPNFKNALRLYMATKCLSPILGDDRCGQRIVKVNELPVDLGSRNPQSTRPYVLPPEYLKALQLDDGESSAVPVHMHLHSFKFFVNKKFEELDLKITPPEWFIWTCEQLQLDIRKTLKLNQRSS